MKRRVLSLFLGTAALSVMPGCKSQNWGGPGPMLDGKTLASGEGAETTGDAPSAVPANEGPVEAPAATGHPRLWVRSEDLPKLRRWAAAPGGLYTTGLKQVAERAAREMDKNEEPFNQSNCADSTGTYTCEAYAELFAFMSLVSPSDGERARYATRARTVLMRLMNEAAKGKDTKTDDSHAIRAPLFSTDDRSRWNGEAFALTVDWIYGALSAADKATIRKVFLRWCQENVDSSITTSDHPEPRGVVNNPALVKDPKAVRYSSNNYFTAHMRNIGLMSLALDPKDDAGDKLRGYLRNATGAWLYMVDYLLKHDARGGLGPEGYEYGPQTLSYVMQFLLALRTSGEDKAATWGPQVNLGKDVFWSDALRAYFHLVSPAPVASEEHGSVYQPVWPGDGQRYWAPDFIDMFGPIGVFGQLAGNPEATNMARYIETHYPPGGASGFNERVSKEDTFRRSILYFLLFEPGAKVTDPRASVPLGIFSAGMGHYFGRTGWGTDATTFDYNLGWITIDHQHADGNNFGFYRHGEWLTKRRVGYGDEIAATDSHNGLALENDKPDHNGEGDYRRPLWKRGSEWIQGLGNADGKILAQSETPAFVYFLGDATGLYDSDYERSTDILHASRSIVWLKPDHIFVYDRAISKTDKRFKRFWLQLPAVAGVVGNVATTTTAKGQKLVVTKVLPEDGVISSALAEPLKDEVAEMEPMRARIKTEVPGGPRDVRFLHVLQGTDAVADLVTRVQSRAGAAYEGAVVHGTAILVPRVLGAPVNELVYSVPSATRAHLVTGLAPNTAYDVVVENGGADTVVTLKIGNHPGPKGVPHTSDRGGVVSF